MMMTTQLSFATAETMELTNDTLPNMIYYLTRSPPKQKIVMDDIPLPQTTWLRTPRRSCSFHKDCDAERINQLSDSIVLHLNDLKHLVIQEIPPFKATTKTSTTTAAADASDPSEISEPARRTTIDSLHGVAHINRKGYQTRQLPRRYKSTSNSERKRGGLPPISSSERKRLPPRTSERKRLLPPRLNTVPKNIFLEATENRRTSTGTAKDQR